MTIPRFTVLAALCAAVILVATAGVAVAATNPDVDWETTFGNPGGKLESAHSVEQTADGGYILAGSTGSSFGSPDTDAWIIKTDASGQQQWIRTFDMGDWEVATDAVQTADGGYAVVVRSQSITNWVYSYRNVFIKTDASGNWQWSTFFECGEHDRLDHLVQVPDGGYVMAGSVYSMGDPDGDGWLVKIDASGNQQWNRTFGGGSIENVTGLIRTADGGFALSGYTGVGLSGADGWLVKTDASGNQSWAKTYHGQPGWEELDSVRQTADGGYVLPGMSTSPTSGNPRAWVVRTDASGTQQWSKFYSVGAGQDYAVAVFERPGGGYLATGGSISSDMSRSYLWLFTLNSTGDRLWEHVYGAASPTEGSPTTDGGYIIAGSNAAQGPFGNAAWLAKIRPGSTGGGGGGSSNTFWDVPSSHPYHDAIEGIAGAGVINGYNDGSFGPGKPVTRQQFAKMIVGTLGFPCSEADICPFSDVVKGGPTDLYPDNYVAVAAAYGITNGIGGGKYGPYRDITRAQVITMVVRAAQNYTAGLQSPDAAYYSGWGLFRGFNDPTHGNNAQLAEFNGLLTGLQGSGDIAAWMWQPATRGEVAQILWNLSNVGVAG